MLTRLHVQGYKALRDIDTTLEPLTVIVGPNGCGKTSVLEAIAAVWSLGRTTKGRTNASFSELRSKAASTPLAIELRARLDKDALASVEHLPKRNAIRASLPNNPTEGAEQSSFMRRLLEMGIDDPKLQIDDDEIAAKLRHESTGSDWELTTHFPWHYAEEAREIEIELYAKHFSHIRKLEPDPRVMSQPSYSPDTIPQIGPSGENLATVLSWLQGEIPERFEEIQVQLREFVPTVERIRTRRAVITQPEPQNVLAGQDEHGKDVYVQRSIQRELVGNEVLLDFHHAKGVQARHVSEGTLLLLGLLTFANTERVSTLLLDDADRALHPKAQQQLVAYLRKLTERGIQIIATTHSPYFVLHLEYEEVRAMMMSDAGGALIGKLTDNPEYNRWREDMTPSEFWTVFGEEWLAKAKTMAEGHG